MIDRLTGRWFPHTDSQAGVLFCAEMLLNVSQPVMSSMTTTSTEAQLAQRQMDVVTYHEQLLGREFVKIQQGADGTATQVHIRLGLDKQKRLVIHAAFCHQRLEFFPESAHGGMTSKRINDLKADIVACAAVATPGIAQTDDDLHKCLSVQ
jgi:hypothetical protein